MCGRFSLRLPAHEIRQLPGHDDIAVDDWVDEDHFVPRYNIAPRTQGAVLRLRDPGPSDASSTPLDSPDGSSKRPTPAHPQYILQSMKWGLVPHWSKFEDKTLSTTNARSESLVEGGGMWASIKGRKRCAVLCQGYYEWLNRGKDKLPHFTKHKGGKLMLMAGLYDCVTLEGESTPLWTFTIVTTAANSEFSWLHDRQPVILSTAAALRTWLDTSSQAWTPELTKLVEPYHDESSPLECYQVPKEVGKVGTESATYIEPVSGRKDGIQAMFSKQTQKKSLPQSLSQDVKPKPHDLKSPKPSPQAPTSQDQDHKPPRGLKRSQSPTDLPNPQPPKTPHKKPKLVKSQSPDPEITFLPSPPKKSKSSSAARSKTSPEKRGSQSPKKKNTATTSSSKITSFFGKN